MKRGSLIALGLSAITLALLYSQRRASAANGADDEVIPREEEFGRPPPTSPGGGTPVPDRTQRPSRDPFTNVFVPGQTGPTPGPRPGPGPIDTAPPYVTRARELIAKAKRDVASVTAAEASEMANLASLLRVSGYGFDYEASSLDTLLRIREAYRASFVSP